MDREDDEFDIYADLDQFDYKEQVQAKEIEVKDLTEKLNNLIEEITKIQKEKAELANEKNIMLKNMSSLLFTAKNEIRRKDENINQLRKEKDDICFRRTKEYKIQKLPPKDEKFIQTDLSFSPHMITDNSTTERNNCTSTQRSDSANDQRINPFSKRNVDAKKGSFGALYEIDMKPRFNQNRLHYNDYKQVNDVANSFRSRTKCHDKQPHDKQPHDKQPHDKQPHDKQHHDKQHHDRHNHDKQYHDLRERLNEHEYTSSRDYPIQDDLNYRKKRRRKYSDEKRDTKQARSNSRERSKRHTKDSVHDSQNRSNINVYEANDYTNKRHINKDYSDRSKPNELSSDAKIYIESSDDDTITFNQPEYFPLSKDDCQRSPLDLKTNKKLECHQTEEITVEINRPNTMDSSLNYSTKNCQNIDNNMINKQIQDELDEYCRQTTNKNIATLAAYLPIELNSEQQQQNGENQSMAIDTNANQLTSKRNRFRKLKSNYLFFDPPVQQTTIADKNNRMSVVPLSQSHTSFLNGTKLKADSSVKQRKSSKQKPPKLDSPALIEIKGKDKQKSSKLDSAEAIEIKEKDKQKPQKLDSQWAIENKEKYKQKSPKLDSQEATINKERDKQKTPTLDSREATESKEKDKQKPQKLDSREATESKEKDKQKPSKLDSREATESKEKDKQKPPKLDSREATESKGKDKQKLPKLDSQEATENNKEKDKDLMKNKKNVLKRSPKKNDSTTEEAHKIKCVTVPCSIRIDRLNLSTSKLQSSANNQKNQIDEEHVVVKPFDHHSPKRNNINLQQNIVNERNSKTPNTMVDGETNDFLDEIREYIDNFTNVSPLKTHNLEYNEQSIEARSDRIRHEEMPVHKMKSTKKRSNVVRPETLNNVVQKRSMHNDLILDVKPKLSVITMAENNVKTLLPSTTFPVTFENILIANRDDGNSPVTSNVSTLQKHNSMKSIYQETSMDIDFELTNNLVNCHTDNETMTAINTPFKNQLGSLIDSLETPQKLMPSPQFPINAGQNSVEYTNVNIVHANNSNNFILNTGNVAEELLAPIAKITEKSQTSHRLKLCDKGSPDNAPVVIAPSSKNAPDVSGLSSKSAPDTNAQSSRSAPDTNTESSRSAPNAITPPSKSAPNANTPPSNQCAPDVNTSSKPISFVNTDTPPTKETDIPKKVFKLGRFSEYYIAEDTAEETTIVINSKRKRKKR